MTSGLDETEVLSLKKDEFLFLAGDIENDLYIVKRGQVMVFVQNASQITPIAFLGEGEYIGELSFFERKNRSASIICIENSEFIKIRVEVLNKHIPPWLRTLGEQLARKVRAADEIIRSRGIRKKNVESVKPLSISEQTRIHKLIENRPSKK